MKEDGGRAPAGGTVWLAPLLDRGRIVEAGQPSELLDRPAADAARAMVAARLAEVGLWVGPPVGR